MQNCILYITTTLVKLTGTVKLIRQTIKKLRLYVTVTITFEKLMVKVKLYIIIPFVHTKEGIK